MIVKHLQIYWLHGNVQMHKKKYSGLRCIVQTKPKPLSNLEIKQ